MRQELSSNLFALVRNSRELTGYPADVESSTVLQAAVNVLGEKMGGLPDVALYRSFYK